MKLLIHTPISNRAWILPEWWEALRSQIGADDRHMLFDLNDSQDETDSLLEECVKSRGLFQSVMVQKRDWPPLQMADHSWSEERYRRMRVMRNEALEAAKAHRCDYLFSLDSDVILHDRDTLLHLVSGIDQPIIAGVFLAKWGNPTAEPLPNVWQCGQFEMTRSFLSELPRADHHLTVGGLGACTLIRRDVWEAGVNYKPIYNLPSNYRGEDRAFCVRAAASGFILKACAHKRIEHRDKPKIEKEAVCQP